MMYFWICRVFEEI